MFSPMPGCRGPHRHEQTEFFFVSLSETASCLRLPDPPRIPQQEHFQWCWVCSSRKATVPAFVSTTKVLTHCCHYCVYSLACLSALLLVPPSDRARTQVRPGRPQRGGEVHPPQDDGLGRAQDSPEVCMHACIARGFCTADRCHGSPRRDETPTEKTWK